MAKKPKSKFALLDICVPIYGEWALAEQTIRAIPAACEGLNDEYQVIVLDNGTPEWVDADGNKADPKDQALAIKELLRRQDKFYRINENAGYPGGVNAAVAKGHSPLVLVLTADVIMQPGSIAQLVRAMDDPELGIVGPKLVFPDGSPHGPAESIQHAGMAFDIKGDAFHIFIGWNKDHPKANIPMHVAAVTGACFITRRALWTRIGGMNEMYGAGTFEDMEYCFIVRQLGKHVLYEPRSWGYHYVGGSIRQGAGKAGFNLTLNRMMFRGRWAGMLSWDEWQRW